MPSRQPLARRKLWPIRHFYFRPVCRLPTQPWWTAQKQRIRTGGSVLVYILSLLLYLILAMWIGAEVQQRHVDRAPSTADLYNTTRVCALLVPEEISLNATASVSAEKRSRTSGGGAGREFGFANTEESTEENNSNEYPTGQLPWIQTIELSEVDSVEQESLETQVVTGHCGDCGACSNPHDVHLYDKTKNNLTATTISCARRILFRGPAAVSRCMQERVGFTNDCNKCWIQNIQCDVRKCLFVCMWNAIFQRVRGTSEDGRMELNPCTRCDELRCGRQFLECAGANRRRVGILSDIARDNAEEVCTETTPEEWWKSDDLQRYWQVSKTQHGALEKAESNEDTRRLRAAP